MSTILTAAGESLIASLQAQGKGLVIDTMILALIPDQDHTQAIEPGVTVPDEALIALRYAIPPEYRAYVNPNQVVYSAMLGSDMGDFSFNWQGLYCSEHDTLVAVATFPALEKRQYDEVAGKTGNNLTRNFLLTFTGARELTGLTISADVWQLDFTVRLNGIDERERLSNFDIYGQGYFEGDGWLLAQTAEAYAFAPGLGYVGGIRAYLAESLPLAAPEAASLPQAVWLDVCLKPSGSDRVAEVSPLLIAPDATLADSAADETGLLHYRALVARIEADGTVTDLRPKRAALLVPHEEVDPAHAASHISFDNATAKLPGAPDRVQKALEALGASMALVVSVLPGSVIAFAGTFGGDAGRNPIPRGGTEPDTGWLLCDGGDDGAGGTVPDLRERMILGASDAHPAGTTGGAESHTHTVSGTTGATTLTAAQMPYHCHSYPYYRFDGGESNPAALANNATLIQQTNPSTYTGGSQAHSHSLTVSSGAASSLPPYYALAYIMKL